ncbi:MAG: hypothetical protein ACM3QS_14670 [Bacteroidota bacterium]
MNKNPSRVPVSGKKPIEVDLGDNSPDDYVVESKTMDPATPAAAPDGTAIDWFNSFGIRYKDKTKGNYANISYTVIMDAIPSTKRLFAYFNGAVQEFTLQTDTGTLKNMCYRTAGGKTTAALSVGDPPLGYGP